MSEVTNEAIKLNYAFDTAIRDAFSSGEITISENEKKVCELFSIESDGYYDVRVRYTIADKDYSVKFEILNNVIMVIKSNFEGKYCFKNNKLSLILPVGTYHIHIDVEYAYKEIAGASFNTMAAGDISSYLSFSEGITIPKLYVNTLETLYTDTTNLNVAGSLNVRGTANFETLSVTTNNIGNESIEITKIDSCKELETESINVNEQLTATNTTITGTLNAKRYRK